MKLRILIICFLSSLMSQAQSFHWVRTFGTSTSEQSSSICTDAQGNVYNTGYFYDTVDFDPGPGVTNLISSGISDMYVQKFDNSGNFLWAKSFGGSQIDRCHSIAIDSDGNIYLTGEFRGTADFDPDQGTFNMVSTGAADAFIVKLNDSGNFIWARSFNAVNNVIAHDISTDSDGNVLTIGYYFGTADFDPGVGSYSLSSVTYSDVFVSKLDSAGNFLWAKSFGSTGTSYGYGITSDEFGNVYTTGVFSSTSDFDPNTGVYNLVSNGLKDVFISKLDPSGNFIFAKSFGSPNDDYGYAINSDQSGSVYCTGKFSGTVDFDPGPGVHTISSNGENDAYVLKLNETGGFGWVKSVGGFLSDDGRSVTNDSYGNVLITGSFQDTVDFDPGAGVNNLISTGYSDIFVQKLDSAGNHIWANSFGGTGFDNGADIAVDYLGNTYTTGNFYYSVDFDQGAGIANEVSNGSADGFIHKQGACQTNYSAQYATACYSYSAPSGNYTWISSGMYADTLQNINGCDSIITINLTINNPTVGTDVINACDSYTWIDGITYTSSNNSATYTLVNSMGCDSLITLDLTIDNSYSISQNAVACNSYTWPINGMTYNTSGNYTATYSSITGCDSIITLDLVVYSPDVSTSISGLTITANNSNAISYHWLDCDNGYVIIPGENSPSFTATSNGNYAVRINDNGCIDTSDCISINDVGLSDGQLLSSIKLYPNPTRGSYSIDLRQSAKEVSVTLFDLHGKEISSAFFQGVQTVQMQLDQPPGMYLVKVEADDVRSVLRIVKE